MNKYLIAAIILLFAAATAATPDDYALHQINSTHWYFETNQNDLSVGIYDYQAFANNVSSDYRILEYSEGVNVTFLSQTPSTIYYNSTGDFNVTFGISHATIGINNTTVSFIYNVIDTITGEVNHSIRYPSNDRASLMSATGEYILRADNRNSTTPLNFEDNASITGGDVYTWGGGDENTSRMTIETINSTYSKVHWNGTLRDTVFQSAFPLDRIELQNSVKTQYPVDKSHDLIFKLWDLDTIKNVDTYIAKAFLETSLGAKSPLKPLEVYYLNSSYDPEGTVDITSSPYSFYLGSHNATSWVDHISCSQENSSYIRLAITNSSEVNSSGVTPTNTCYIALISEAATSKSYYVNITNAATSTNRSFAETNTTWIGGAAPYSEHLYTVNAFSSFRHKGERFQMKLYAADNNGIWNNTTILTTNIDVSKFPPTTPDINHFHFNSSEDHDMNRTYSGTFEIGCGIATDPDGGVVTHNLTLYYANQTYIATINNTFTKSDITHGVYADISFNSTPYYSETEEYTLKIVATDDEGETSESWSCCNFTLGTHQISNIHTTTLVYDRIVWGWTNPDHYDTIMVYLDNIWKQNTTGTSYSASGLNQATAYTIKLITVYAGEESDPVTDTQVTTTEQGGSGGGGGTPAPTPTPTATPTITPVPGENVTENVSIAIEPIPDITEDIVSDYTVTGSIWHLSFEKHAVFVPEHPNIIACNAVPPYACRYYEDQKKFEIVIDGESPEPVFTAYQWVTFITRDGKRISQRINTKVYNPLFYFTMPAISGSVGDFSRYFVHGNEHIIDGVRFWWIGMLVIGGITYHWRRKKNE